MNNEQETGERGVCALSILRIRPEGHQSEKTNGGENPEIFNLIQCNLADREKNNQQMKVPRRYLNSASIGVICRRMIATEWARALGRRPPDFRAFARRRKAKVSGRPVW